MELTNEQSKPVYSNSKINVVNSTPGSGKSTVIIARATRLWKESEEPVLIVTFSTAGKKAVEDRLTPDLKVGIDVKTIHSLCLEIITEFWSDLREIIGSERWPEKPILVDREREIEIIEELFPTEDSSKTYEKFLELRRWQVAPETLLRIQNQGAYIEKLRKMDLEMWLDFERSRKSRGLITFDDMIALAKLVIPLPNVAVKMSRKYRHVLIDEAQDTSENEWDILRPLVISAETTLVAADVNQALYGFRGADGSLIQNIRAMPDAVSFRLAETFRCGSNVAELANKLVVDNSSQIIPKGHLGSVNFKAFKENSEEIDWVLGQLDNDSAIISRTNSYLEPFERELISKKIPYKGVAFYRSHHVKDLYRFLKDYTGDNPQSIISKAYIQNSSYSVMEKEDFKLILRIIAKESLEKFFSLVEKAEYVDLEGVTLITGHGSKGLEWNKVFLVGCHNGHIPHKRSRNEKEERNILYVMTTRAKKDLKISYLGDPSVYLKEYVRDSNT